MRFLVSDDVRVESTDETDESLASCVQSFADKTALKLKNVEMVAIPVDANNSNLFVRWMEWFIGNGHTLVETLPVCCNQGPPIKVEGAE